MNGDKCPEGMSYGQWLREKGIGIKVTPFNTHQDSGMPQEYIDRAKGNEIFERNKARQGGVINPEDMENKELDLEKLVGSEAIKDA